MSSTASKATLSRSDMQAMEDKLTSEDLTDIRSVLGVPRDQRLEPELLRGLREVQELDIVEESFRPTGTNTGTVTIRVVMGAEQDHRWQATLSRNGTTSDWSVLTTREVSP